MHGFVVIQATPLFREISRSVWSASVNVSKCVKTRFIQMKVSAMMDAASRIFYHVTNTRAYRADTIDLQNVTPPMEKVLCHFSE